MSLPSKTTTPSWHLPLFFTLFLPIVAAFILFRLDPFHPAHFPPDTMSRRNLTAPARYEHMRRGLEAVAEGHVEGPEDLVYDAATRVLYTGWIKRVTVKESMADSTVESLVHTGGRPLGVALDRNGQLIVADSDKVIFFLNLFLARTEQCTLSFLFRLEEDHNQ